MVLLGLRMVIGSMIGRDHVITQVTGRLIPVVFLTLAHPVLVARGFGLLNAAATSLGQVAIGMRWRCRRLAIQARPSRTRCYGCC
ncbi:MAG: hypothetical protein LC797_17430 [Chloroflexi bacterium]|nr:hypothetical protein [Chloroflexota bacterium]